MKKWDRDNEPLFGLPNEPEVIVSMTLGHSVLFKLRRRMSVDIPSVVVLEHGDLLVIDGQTRAKYEHSVASGLTVRSVGYLRTLRSAPWQV